MAQPGATTLTSLPCELLELTAESLDPKDLLNLRLVCKDVSAKCEKQMSRQNFGKLHIMLDLSSSLKQATAVTSRKHLCSSIKRIVIWVDKIKHTADPRRIGWDVQPTVKESRSIRYAKRQQLKVFNEEQKQFSQSGEGYRQLLKVLLALKPFTNQIGLAFDNIGKALDGHSGNGLPTAYSKLVAEYGTIFEFSRQPDMNVLWCKVFNSIHTSQLSISSLSLPMHQYIPTGLDSHAWPKTLTIPQPYLNGLEELNIEMFLYRVDQSLLKSAVATILALASTLRVFKLCLLSDNGWYPDVLDILDQLAEEFYSPRLQELDLRFHPDANPDVFGMLQLLIRHKETLRLYNLGNYKCFGDEAWESRVREAGVSATRLPRRE